MPDTERLADIEMPSMEPALRTAEVAKVLGVSARAVRTWADEGKIACYRTFGGHRLFAVSEVNRVLMSWRRPGHAAPPIAAGDGAVPAPEDGANG